MLVLFHELLSGCTNNNYTTVTRASSTWKHDTRKFGPQNALDSQSDAAWKSAPSEDDPLAYFELYFHRPVIVNEMRLQYQGGFAGMDCIVYKKKRCTAGEQNNDDDEEWEEFDELFVDPIDSNEIQTFPIERDANETNDESCTALRIEFGKSTDFYGRIVVYSLEVWGVEATKQQQEQT